MASEDILDSKDAVDSMAMEANMVVMAVSVDMVVWLADTVVLVMVAKLLEKRVMATTVDMYWNTLVVAMGVTPLVG